MVAISTIYRAGSVRMSKVKVNSTISVLFV